MTTVYRSLGGLFRSYVPEYKSRQWKHLNVGFYWDPEIAQFMRGLSDKRADNRLKNYLIPGELSRSRGAIRFGMQKEGHGYHGTRGDFCLVGGAYHSKNLTLFYRRVEMIGGLHYDTLIINEVEQQMGPINRVYIMAAEAFAFCLKGNSNEKLYTKLREHYKGAP